MQVKVKEMEEKILQLEKKRDKVCRVTTLPGKSWKVMEFSKNNFQAWKVMENSQGHGKS